MPSKRRLAKNTPSSVTPTTESLKLAQRIVDSCKLERQAFKDAMDQYLPSQLQGDTLESVNNWRLTHLALARWEEVGRQVLSIHDGLVTELRYSSSSKIEPAVFHTLPYLNPMVVFPSPPQLHPQVHGSTNRLLGFFGLGRRENHPDILDSHDSSATAFLAYCMVEVTHPDGSTDLELDFVSMPMDGEPYTMAECVDNIVRSYEWSVVEYSDANKNRFMKELLTYVLGSVMYLCSTTLEAEKVPRKTLMSHFPEARRAPFSMYRVGWQIGAALSARRKLVDTKDPSQQSKPGYEQDPQHRRAHFKTIWTGKGSRIPKLAFIAPYWTHREKLGTSGVNTVRKVIPPGSVA